MDLKQALIDCYELRRKAFFSQANTLNMILEMRLVALQGNTTLQKRIDTIAGGLPPAHSGDNGGRVYSFIVGQTFVSLVSEFENYLVDVMTTIAEKYPQKLGQEPFKLSEILELKDQELIVRVATERHINSVMYKKANEYRKSLIEFLSAEPNFLSDLWPAYVECKARRDLGVHNGWRTNDVYKRKLLEVGITPSSDLYFTPTSEYFFQSLKLMAEISDRIKNHCAEKFSS